ncbi:MAG: bifunctional ornithine acetyltransferase/N-acetylglutamate synthase, partial [Euryarchaeota archaeon]|nr:bifunctional ornithine acetyltransferase/N-acetylglutamate synthase [Euryarchaeota archaeon]
MWSVAGGIGAVPGVRCAGTKEGRFGLALIQARGPAAGVFTTNQFPAAPVQWSRRVVRSGPIEALIANSGCANALTGREGHRGAREMARLAARGLRVDHRHVAVASTGIIGRPLNLRLIERQVRHLLPRMEGGPGGAMGVARSILTTDTEPKEVALESNGVRIGGVCKGSGMIAPRMATMLAFLFTDARASRATLQTALSRAADNTFNMVVIDGDTSTNDMLLLVSTRRGPEVTPAQLGRLVEAACMDLTRQIAEDGEGATRLLTARVQGARSTREARQAARALVASPLIKTAIHGADPNWGRVVAALGYS